MTYDVSLHMLVGILEDPYLESKKGVVDILRLMKLDAPSQAHSSVIQYMLDKLENNDSLGLLTDVGYTVLTLLRLSGYDVNLNEIPGNERKEIRRVLATN